MNSSDAKDNEARRQLGLRLQAARKQRGLSQAELATRGGLSQSQISKLERGERDLIYRDACTLAVSLGLPLQWLIDGRLRPSSEEIPGHRAGRLRLSDLRVPQHPEAEVLGAFRALEEIIPLALTGSSEPRIVEALPVLPILHPLDARLLFAFARRAGVLRRVGLILDISLFLLRRGSWISPSLVQGDEDEIERFLTLAFEAIKEEPSRSDPHADHPILKRWHAELGINIEDYEVRARQLLEGRDKHVSSSDEEVGRLRTFLGELAAVWQERRPGEGLDLYLLGGASVILHFDLNVHTLDIDVVMPKETKDELSEVLSDFLKGGARTKGGGYFLDLVNQAFNYMPAAYRERATIAEAFGAVKVWRLDPHDLILSKIKRFAPKDKGHIRDLLERYPGKFDEYEMRRLFDTQFQFAPDIEAQCELRLQRIIGFMNGENRSLD